MKNDKQTKRKRARMEETTTPKKPTSRTRSRNSSASSAASAGGGVSHSAAALGESKVVWKDSPVEKHIKVSGTGKCVTSLLSMVVRSSIADAAPVALQIGRAKGDAGICGSLGAREC